MGCGFDLWVCGFGVVVLVVLLFACDFIGGVTVVSASV